MCLCFVKETLNNKIKVTKGQFGNVISFKIIVISYTIEIINRKENQLSIW